MSPMEITLPDEMKQFVERKVQAGEYESADLVILAGLAALAQQEQFKAFAPGELDALLADAEEDFANGATYDGEEVFREIREMSAARRREQSK